MTTLEVEHLEAGYGPVQVLRGVDFRVEEGQIAVILGANGAGKTTSLRALSGMIRRTGSIRFGGTELSRKSVDAIVRAGVAHVPQGRGTFPSLTVEENLRLGAYTRRDADIGSDIQRSYGWFPRLEERKEQTAGSLSGGEQQMLAIARALMLRPKLLLLDEPSLGLAPIITQELFAILRQINTDLGTTMLVVEQNANLALDLASYGYVLETGSIVFGGPSAEVRGDEAVRRAYLGY